MYNLVSVFLNKTPCDYTDFYDNADKIFLFGGLIFGNAFWYNV